MSNNYSETSESYGKCRKRYIDYPKGKSKPTCLIHVPGSSLDECKILGDFGSKYAKIGPNKDRGKNPANINKCNKQQENNVIVNITVDGILLHENQRISAEKGSHENIESDFDEIGLYQIDNMSLDDTNSVWVCH